MKKQIEPPPKTKTKPKLTDAERHKRFVDMVHEVEAEESPEAFDRAFERAVSNPGNGHHSHKPHTIPQADQ